MTHQHAHADKPVFPLWLVNLLEERDRALEDWTHKLAEALRTGGNMAAIVSEHSADLNPHDQYALYADLVAHGAAANPHPTYATDADLATHAAAADPHPVYAFDADLVAYIAKAIVDLKGDLIVASAPDVVGRLPVGTNGKVLTADSAEAFGVKWATPASGADNATDVNNMGVVVHGATAATARPAWDGRIFWIGSVAPTNALTNDIWAETT